VDTVLRYAVMRTTITLSCCRPLSFPLCHCVQPTSSWALSSFSNAAPLRKVFPFSLPEPLVSHVTTTYLDKSLKRTFIRRRSDKSSERR
jgi:hypothetical protein